MPVNSALIKQANDVAAHRELSPDEEQELDAGKSRWLPRIFQSYGTPIPELMASPAKTGLIFGVPAGLLGAAAGAGMGGAMSGKNYSPLGALVGGLGLGGAAYWAASSDREAKNEGLEEILRRMPEGAAKRDLLADPQYQSDFLGWDNSKIVATARARYYRPTERFTKRTSDMVDARERYNERQKTSSINKDVSMNQTEKQAMNPKTQMVLNYLLRSGVLGSAVGGAAGAVTSKNKLRGMARGMLMGAGTGVGIGTGLPMGAGLSGGAVMGLSGRPSSVQDFQNLANATIAGSGVGGTLGGVAGYSGGKALADALVGPAEDEDGNIPDAKKKEAHALLNNNTLTLAEKFAAYGRWLQKQADEDDLTLPMSPSPARVPAMASAPDTKVSPLPEDLILPGVPNRRPMVPDITSKPKAFKAPRMAPEITSLGQNTDSPALRAAVADITGKNMDADAAGSAIAHSSRADRAQSLAKADADARAARGAKADRQIMWDTVKGTPGALWNRTKDVVGGAGSRVYNAAESLGKYLKPEPTKLPDPTMWDKLKPYAPYAAVGAGGLGALALADYLSRRKKKKTRTTDSEEEERPVRKAANINWYALKNQKQSNALTLARAGTSMIPYSRVGAGLSRLRSALSGLPQWAKVTGGVGAAGGAGAGLGYLGNLALGGKDPSMLEKLKPYAPYAAAGLGTAGLLGGAAYMGSQSGKKKKKKPEEKKANLGNAGMGALAGAGALGLGGGLYGALAPGHETDPMTGRRRRRGRLSGALRGLLGGAALGGVGGGAAGYLAGDKLKALLAAHLAKQQGGGDPTGPGGMRVDTTTQTDPLNAAKAEAATPVSGPIPQGPTSMTTTTGSGQPPSPIDAMTGSVPGGNIPNMQLPQTAPAPLPQAPVVQQAPASFSATTGGMPQPTFNM